MSDVFNMERIQKNTKTFSDKAGRLRFLLGGIGTGNVSIDARGGFCDFEIFNQPDKDLKLPYSFFSIYSKIGKSNADARILEAKHIMEYDSPLGISPGELSGLPRFDSSEFSSNYPFADVRFIKEDLPLSVEMEAFTPFIPLNAKDSGIPGFRVVYRVKNLAKEDACVSLCGTMPNACGIKSISHNEINSIELQGDPVNSELTINGLKGILYSTESSPDTYGYGTMALMAEGDAVTLKTNWQTGFWWDGAEEFWQDFRDDGELSNLNSSIAIGSNINAAENFRAIGSVAVKKTIKPGHTERFTFYLTWNFPNRYGWWPDGHRFKESTPDKANWTNYYSKVWCDASAAVKYLHNNIERLEETSRNFSNALYNSTLDIDVIDALASNITVLRSTTCFRVADGSFFGWEGCFKHAGSCPGNCTHVWNYAQTLAFLFPELEMDMRKTEFFEETDESGYMAFRALKKLQKSPWKMLPAADGQLGCILRVYREWKITGDDSFLRKIWSKVVLSMTFACSYWDSDSDYVLDTKQHNTYDIEFYGINSLTNSIFFASLTAAVEMAEYLGERELAEKWRNGAQKGSEALDKILWNGEYYEQKISDEALNQYKYQYGEGCLSDQVFGQELAHLYGLGYILPPEHIKKAVGSIYKYNFKTSMKDHESVQRGYVYQDEPGLLLCTWPKGKRPKQPFIYSDEVWTGIEYQVAVGLIYEGMIDEAMNIVHGVRSRFDGYKRNPFNENECGNHYARSMASWGLLIALSGFSIKMPGHLVIFDPKVNKDDFACFYSAGDSWGIYTEKISADGIRQKKLIPLYNKDS